MAEDQVTIDMATLLDDTDARAVEFDGEASDETYRFAVQYDVLEALSAIARTTKRSRCSSASPT